MDIWKAVRIVFGNGTIGKLQTWKSLALQDICHANSSGQTTLCSHKKTSTGQVVTLVLHRVVKD
jgi:hypothetical protein